MAIGFIKKMFSFGKKDGDERPVEEQVNEQSVQTPETADETAPLAEQADSAELIENLVDDAAPQEDATAESLPEDHAISSTVLPVTTEPIATEAVNETEADIHEIEIVIEQPVAIEPARTEISEQAPASSSDEVHDEPDAPAEFLQEDAILISAEPEISATGAEINQPVSHKVQVAKDVVVAQKQDEPEIEEKEAKLSWFERLRKGLSRSSSSLNESIGGIFTKRKLDEDTLQDLEDVLIQADLGLETAMRITDTLSSGRYGKNISDDEVHNVLSSEIEKVLTPIAKPLELDLSHKPHVILVVGVNGTGKTTTIGKLAAKLTAGGLKVMLAAGDTFRAAAIEQLHIWGKRTGSPVVSSKLGADAAGLAYDAWEKAKEAGSDVLIIDTAGRLQNKTELMDELAKIVRVLAKHDPDAPHTVLQTLDATTGQNALNQVEIFQNVAGVNGLVMTKLDGTARGGILVAISAKHKLPVYFIGVGEGIDDLEPFAAKDFAQAIAGVKL